MKPLVSILIPAYNADSVIADTIRSALAQTWPNKEIIIVDDGSKDNTLAVAQTFSAPNVKVIAQPNQGAATARNHALSFAQGDFIQWLDADDLISRDKITLQMNAAERGSDRRKLLSSGWAYFIYRPQKAKFIPSELWESLSPLEWLMRKWENNLHMQTATWLVSRELTAVAGPWDPQMLSDDDGEYFFRVIKVSSGTEFVPDAKIFYRISGVNRLSYIGRSNKRAEAQWVSMKRQIGLLRSISDDPRARAACVTYLQNWLFSFYPDRMDLVEQAKQLAAELGGQLHPPELSWKYLWIQKTLGWRMAKQMQLTYNEWKAAARRSWDKAMFQLERTDLAAQLGENHHAKSVTYPGTH